MRCTALFLILVAPLLAQRTVELEPITVDASRSQTPLWATPLTPTVLNSEFLAQRPTSAIDEALRTVPAFSLFRRGSSLALNPTAQGVSLRGLGPSGASRSLVLLDGVPLNDAFGGWISWGKVSTASLDHVEVLPAGGASAWGNAALSGVISLTSRTPEIDHGNLQASVGAFGTRAVEGAGSFGTGGQAITAEVRAYHTDGYTPIAPDDRGAVDRDAEIDQRRIGASWQSSFGPHLRATLRGRWFSDERNNGTLYQENRSDERSLSGRIESVDTGDLSWEATAYLQGAGYRSTFSSINATRQTETPASEQFEVPATAWGAGTTARWAPSPAHTLTGGADWRSVQGETRENYSYAGNAYTRQRFAGGAQDFGGVFAQYERDWSPHWRTSVAARGDHWRQSEGHRRETVIATGATTRNDRWAASAGGEFSPSLGVIWRPSPAWRLHASAQRSFRRPTLNELFRPFRQGSDQTDANPDLRTEHARGVEIGAAVTTGRLRLASSAFAQELTDAVANVTLYRGPGTYPDFGFIPEGGSGRRRLNLERLSVKGLDSSATLSLPEGFALRLAWLWSNARVREASVAPQLVGRRLAETPEHTATGTLSWSNAARWSAYVDLRWSGDQFDDDENRIALADATVVNLGATAPLRRNLDLFVTLENAGGARVETARTATGVSTLAAPRFLSTGLRWTY